MASSTENVQNGEYPSIIIFTSYIFHIFARITN